MNRQTLLWSLVVFFGAGLAFNVVADATDDASTGTQIAAQLVALVVIVALITLIVKRRG